jgi:hypothetical protein
MGAGQFSIFGAVEEKCGRDFPESGGMKQRLSDASFLRWMAAVFVDMKRLEENLVEWAAGISTEGAQEMQKGEVSRFQGFKVSRFQGFKVSRFQGFKVSRFQGFKRRGDARSCLAR